MSDAQGNRLRDLLIYVGAALALLGGIVFLALYSGEHQLEDWRVFEFVGAVISAAIIAGYAAKYRWESRRQPMFWVILLLFAVLHIMGWTAAVMAFGRVRLFAYFLGIAVEFWPLAVILGRLAPAQGRAHSGFSR